MSLHPPAPEELGELVEAYAQTVRTVIDLARTLRPGDAERPTDCPGWTVADQVAHVVGGEVMAAGEDDADADISGLTHVRHAFGARHERAVQLRRGRHLDEVVEELEERLVERLAFYGAEETSADTPVEGPFGATTVGGLLALRTFDIWVHEQDIREAIGRPGGLDTPAAALSVSRVFAAVPRVVARDAQVPAGHAVVLDLTGPTVGRVGARVEEQDGRRVGIALFAGGQEEHPDVVTTSLTMSTRVAMRLAAGRGDRADLHVVVQGDEEIAERVLQSLAMTP